MTNMFIGTNEKPEDLKKDLQELTDMLYEDLKCSRYDLIRLEELLGYLFKLMEKTR